MFLLSWPTCEFIRTPNPKATNKIFKTNIMSNWYYVTTFKGRILFFKIQFKSDFNFTIKTFKQNMFKHFNAGLKKPSLNRK